MFLFLFLFQCPAITSSCEAQWGSAGSTDQQQQSKQNSRSFSLESTAPSVRPSSFRDKKRKACQDYFTYSCFFIKKKKGKLYIKIKNRNYIYYLLIIIMIFFHMIIYTVYEEGKTGAISKNPSSNKTYYYGLF